MSWPLVVAQAVTRINWLEVIKALAAVATTVIAFLALQNWKRQDKAKREAEFLDALVEATHAYIIEMGRPITIVAAARIGMKCHSPKWEDEDETAAVAEGAVPYIQKSGEQDAGRLFEALNVARSAAIALRSLGTKGQVFGFYDYATCKNAIATLTRQFDRIEAFASMIGSPTLNWDHPEIQGALQAVLTVKPEGLQEQLGANNVTVLEFAQTAYRKLYGS